MNEFMPQETEGYDDWTDSPQPLTPQRKRPLGITIFAVLHLVGGVAYLLILIAAPERIMQAGNDVGFSGYDLGAGMAYLTIMLLGSAYGMWHGKHWGWWLAAYYYTYAIARYANIIVYVSGMEKTTEIAAAEVSRQIIRRSGQIVTHLAVIIYFFTKRVIEYYNFKKFSRLEAAVILIISAVLTVAISILRS